jgi:hypothetical protein
VRSTRLACGLLIVVAQKRAGLINLQALGPEELGNVDGRVE